MNIFLHIYIYIYIYICLLTGIARRSVLKELEECDFDKLVQHVKQMMAVAVKKK